MKTEIRCSTCPDMKIPTRAKWTMSSWGMKQTRGQCFCEHPEMAAAFKLINRSNRMRGFIAFTKRDTDEPDIKTAPHWCPRKMMQVPVEISKKEAYQVISDRKPKGLFFLKEGEGYTGIDNTSGEVYVEVFAQKAECLRWLCNKRKKKSK